MSPLRFFLLGPLIVAMAFTLNSPAMRVVQIIAGTVYTALGFLSIWRGKKRT